MGTYSYWEFYEEFGGEPDRDEAVPSLEDADELRKEWREDPLDERKFIGPGIFWDPKLVDDGEILP